MSRGSARQLGGGVLILLVAIAFAWGYKSWRSSREEEKRTSSQVRESLRETLTHACERDGEGRSAEVDAAITQAYDMLNDNSDTETLCQALVGATFPASIKAVSPISRDDGGKVVVTFARRPVVLSGSFATILYEPLVFIDKKRVAVNRKIDPVFLFVSQATDRTFVVRQLLISDFEPRVGAGKHELLIWYPQKVFRHPVNVVELNGEPQPDSRQADAHADCGGLRLLGPLTFEVTAGTESRAESSAK